MSLRKSKLALSFAKSVAGLLPVILSISFATPLQAAPPEDFSGQILGQVKNATGISQMGATVLLFNRYDQLVRQALSNDQGKFVFDALPADIYSIRVSLASFVPAIRRNIAILAGSETLLRINLASVLSSIEVSPFTAPGGALMSDEWKWVLRSSSATRPVLRMLPQHTAQTLSSSKPGPMFSDTTSMLSLSASGNDPLNGALQQVVGTGFGVATSINGRSRVRVSGNLGYAGGSGLPSAGFRATFARSSDFDQAPQISLTARQVYLPSLTGSGTPGSAIGPALRTASLTAVDKLDLGDALHLEYGVGLDSISYYDRLTYMSTFVRGSYELAAGGVAKVAYSSAAEPMDLIPRTGETATDLNNDLSVLSRLPRISRRDGRTTVQRNQTSEAGYSWVDGSRTYSASVYLDDISNAAFLLSGSPNFLTADNMLPDLNSRGLVFNAGRFRRTGYAVAVTQSIGPRFEFLVAAGRGGAFVAGPAESENPSGDAIRNSIRRTVRPWVTARASATLPYAGTHVTASYGWTDFRALTPLHYFLTSRAAQEIGWNVTVRQPLPGWGGMRMEAVADIRNLLAQGYLPIHSGPGQAILTNSPRGLRGGLSFIF